jgi:hypothetical protein
MPYYGLMIGHERIDQRSIALHRSIADKLLANPELMGIAHDNLSRWMAKGGHSMHYFEAWQELLSQPLDSLALLLVKDSEHMRAMRQTGPFAGVVSPQERWAIYDDFPLESLSK